MVELKKIATEQRNPNTMNIDTLPTLEMVRLMNREDHRVAEAVSLVTEEIARAVDLIADRLSKGGRLIYCGAGTSGRLGILDAVECPPTYSTEPEMVPIPRILMEGEEPRVPVEVVIWTPATTPSRALVTSEDCTRDISEVPTTDAEPVNDSFVEVPKATTIVSSSISVSGSSVTEIVVCPATGISTATYPIEEKTRTASDGVEIEYLP